MTEIIRTSSTNQDFIALVRHLDADLLERDGKEQAYYAQFNKIDLIKNADRQAVFSVLIPGR